jgi:integrase
MHGVYRIEGKKGVSFGIDFIHPGTGQRVRKILKTATSEQEAFELRAIEIADAKRGATNTAYGIKDRPKVVSFEKMVEKYLAWSKGNHKAWRTNEHRAKPLKAAFRGKLMSDINPFMVEKYKMLRVKKVEKATVNKELILGRQVFEKAIDWKEWNGENPFAKAEKFKVTQGKKPGSLTPEQVEAIMAEISHPVKRDMVEFDFYCGWRISELRKLKWEDIDLEQGRAWIMDPKNGESVEIDLADEAVAILKRQRRRGEYVFCKLNGEQWKTNLHDTIKNAAQRAGVSLPKRKAWHILRRTWASMFLQNGGDVETLRVLGNWKDSSMPLWYADDAKSAQKKKVLNQIPKLGSVRKMAEKAEGTQLRVVNR